MKFRHFGEFRFIDSIAPLCVFRDSGLIQGIGDDCAIIDFNSDNYLLITTDMMVERVHFNRDWILPQLLGAKALSTNVSDIAACGGVPQDAFISIAVPDSLDVEYVQDLYTGMAEVAKPNLINIMGGDTTGSKTDLVINVALTGRVPKGQALLRSGARAGDLIVVTGPLGESAAGLELLSSDIEQDSAMRNQLIDAHLKPRGHVAQGRILAESGYCTAAIDVSDGLSSDLEHICKQSGVGALIHAEKLPMSTALVHASELLDKDVLEFIVNGGEDYVLLAALDPEGFSNVEMRFHSQGLEIWTIGVFIETPGIQLIDTNDDSREIIPRGWDHFR